MKRGIFLLLCCLLFVVLCSCKNNRKNSEQDNNISGTVDVPQNNISGPVDVSQVQGEGVIFYRGGETFTERTVMYPVGTRGLLCIFDTESHQSVPYCLNPECEHRPSKMSEDGMEVLEEGCPAYDYSQEHVFVCGEHLYFMLDGCLIQADLTGMNRKILCRLSKPYTLGQGNGYYTDEALYIPYFLYYDLALKNENGAEEWIPGEKKEKQEAGVLRIPFTGEKESVIFRTNEYYDMQVVSLWRHDGCICFQVTGRDVPYSVIQEEAGGNWQAMMDVDRRHSFTQAYDYVVETGEIRSFAYEKPSLGGFYFFRGVYGMVKDSNRLELHLYSGELIAETEVPFSGVISDQYVIGYNMDNNKGVLLNPADGKVEKTSPLTYDDFYLEVVVGDGFYGYVGQTRAYISAEDYWSGNKEGIVLFPEVRVADSR